VKGARVHDDPSTAHPSSFLPDPNDGAAPASTESPRSQLPLGDHGTADRICPFLRASADGGALGPPVENPDPANRCVALHEAVPQSLRQQDLLCLSTAHVNCPRYLRGSLGLPAPVEPVTATRTVTPATAAALALFGLAFAVSVGFVVATGGLTLTAAAPTATQGGAVLGEVDTAPPDVVQTPEPTSAPTPTASPSPSPSPTAEPTPEPSPTPAATPEPTAKPKPTSNRYALLKPCPNTPDCYIYVVRSGDNLFSIARYFGVPLKTVQAMNPWTKSGLVAGRDLRIPTPTR
jgi:LysM repeat protein